MTRGQLPLVRCEGNDLMDFRFMMAVVVAAYYCFHSRPPLEDGTDAANAVLAVLLEPQTIKSLVATVCP